MNGVIIEISRLGVQIANASVKPTNVGSRSLGCKTSIARVLEP